MVVRRNDVYVPLGRNAAEMWLLGLCVLSGLQSWHTRVPHLPVWAAWCWYALLVGGGALGVAGAAWRDAITGIGILRAAWLVVGFGGYAWTVALLAVHAAAPLPAAITASFAIMAHVRVWQLSRHLRRGTVVRVDDGRRPS